MKKIFLLAFVWASTFACNASVTTEVSESKSIVYTSNRWPDPQAIPVCWVNGNEVSDEMKNDLRAHVTNEFHNKTNIRFVRWDNCQTSDSSTKTIRAYFSKVHDWDDPSGAVGGGASFIGPGPDKKEWGGIGTMDMSVGKRGEYPQIDREHRINVTRSMVLHEFGHAVGLAHEHDRDDGKCNDQVGTKKNGQDGFVYVGRYDDKSVMTYCRDRSKVMFLSDGDVAGVNFLYPYIAEQPKDLNGEFYLKARHSTRCVDIADGSKDDGGNVRQWGCNNTDAQKFRFLPAKDGTYFIQNVNSGKCVDLQEHKADNGMNIHQWSCHEGDSQRFTVRPSMDGYQMIQSAMTNKCVDVSEVSTSDGANIHQWDCFPDSSNQNFAFVRVK